MISTTESYTYRTLGIEIEITFLSDMITDVEGVKIFWNGVCAHFQFPVLVEFERKKEYPIWGTYY